LLLNVLSLANHERHAQREVLDRPRAAVVAPAAGLDGAEDQLHQLLLDRCPPARGLTVRTPFGPLYRGAPFRARRLVNGNDEIRDGVSDADQLALGAVSSGLRTGRLGRRRPLAAQQ